ncbi:hypothetical protein BRADI_1g17870v3 [Brachypodium distachyon]|uniref:Peroxidase n=1 Tax=Brachypodium distachyon TaxID=15368 RepID=A0A0Q3J9T8_BRADI|nr:hypothetical protein BRADI_1g17870v3 [Brachypodium distachyon]
MASSSLLPSVMLLLCLAASASAQLSPTFYATSCPKALDTIKAAVTAAVKKENRMGASLLRLHFHDCFVQGCDASVLLSGNEQNALPNVGSLRGFEVIDSIKAQVEALCKQTVSCADILTLAARDSVVACSSSSSQLKLMLFLLWLTWAEKERTGERSHEINHPFRVNREGRWLGGPSWTVPLGRRDSLTANEALANSDLPPPFFDLVNLTKSFGDKGFSLTEMVALSGAHTIGQAQCLNFRDRLYNETTSIDAAFAASLKPNCPRPTGAPGDGNLAALDVSTPYYFDNKYYVNLQAKKGLLHSDQVLFNGGGADNIVSNFASSAAAFSGAFASAMVKMGNLGPLTGSQGQVRLSCSKVN